MGVESQLYLFSGLFLLVNILDAYTTWLCLFRLPTNLRAEEKNPIFKFLKIETRFFHAILFKVALILLGVFIFLNYFNSDPGKGLTDFKVLDLVFTFVILNNLYVYLTRRLLKRKTPTLISLVEGALEKVHLKWGKSGLAYLITIASTCVLSAFIVVWW